MKQAAKSGRSGKEAAANFLESRTFTTKTQGGGKAAKAAAKKG